MSGMSLHASMHSSASPTCSTADVFAVGRTYAERQIE